MYKQSVMKADFARREVILPRDHIASLRHPPTIHTIHSAETSAKPLFPKRKQALASCEKTYTDQSVCSVHDVKSSKFGSRVLECSARIFGVPGMSPAVSRTEMEKFLLQRALGVS